MNQVDFVMSTFRQVYRLLSLMSVTGTGFTQKFMDSMKRALVEVYGYEELIRIYWMELGGLISYVFKATTIADQFLRVIG